MDRAMSKVMTYVHQPKEENNHIALDADFVGVRIWICICEASCLGLSSELIGGF